MKKKTELLVAVICLLSFYSVDSSRPRKIDYDQLTEEERADLDRKCVDILYRSDYLPLTNRERESRDWDLVTKLRRQVQRIPAYSLEALSEVVPQRDYLVVSIVVQILSDPNKEPGSVFHLLRDENGRHYVTDLWELLLDNFGDLTQSQGDSSGSGASSPLVAEVSRLLSSGSRLELVNTISALFSNSGDCDGGALEKSVKDPKEVAELIEWFMTNADQANKLAELSNDPIIKIPAAFLLYKEALKKKVASWLAQNPTIVEKLFAWFSQNQNIESCLIGQYLTECFYEMPADVGGELH